MKKDIKEKAIELRRQGMSYSEIRAICPVSKSTLSLWLRDVQLTAEQKNRLKQKEIDIQQAFSELMASRFSEEERMEFSKKGGRNNIIAHPSFPYKGGNAEIASLAYRKAEIPIKKQLEKITGMEFRKELINNKYIPYANDLFLIDYIKDPVKGAQWSINRMALMKNIPRIKIIICAPLSAHYLQQIESQNITGNGIIVLREKDFWEGRFKAVLLPDIPLDKKHPAVSKLTQLLLPKTNPIS